MRLGVPAAEVAVNVVPGTEPAEVIPVASCRLKRLLTLSRILVWSKREPLRMVAGYVGLLGKRLGAIFRA